jgi:DNA-binding CsgD family transcriptional regulator
MAKETTVGNDRAMSTPITSALDFLRIRKEIAAHLELIAEDCGMFDEICENDQKAFANFLENIISFKTSAVLNLLAQEKARNAQETGPQNLTERQAQVIDKLVNGKTNREIATELGFALSTIQHEITSILVHFKLKDREQLITHSLSAMDESQVIYG